MLGPIFAREALTLPRRPRHYVMRTVYLGLLWVLALTAWQAAVGWNRPATLGDTARFGLLLFQILTYVQLTLMLFFAALSGASAITQEKDRRTFILLLMTDLRDREIVLGKLLGSLLQIGVFLAGMVPVLALLLLLGGVSGGQVIDAVIVLGATGVAAGSLGVLIALWRDKTFQALALTVLFLVLYLCLVHALTFLPGLFGLIGLDGVVTTETVERWQVWLEPYLALRHIIAPPPEGAGEFPAAYGFALAMLGLSVLLNVMSLAGLRRWNPSGEPVMQRERLEDEGIDRARAHAAPGPVRKVWANPILWREIATRAYGRKPLLVKLAYFLVVGLICYYAFAFTTGREWAAARGLVPVGIISLLLVSAQAVTAITSERDTGALDLLLVTDLTPREFIFGKLLGILYNTKEFLLPPLILTGVYAYLGVLAAPSPRQMALAREAGDYEVMRTLVLGKNLEAAVCVIAGAVILFAFTMVLGIHVALRNEKSRLAIGHTLGTVFFLSIGTLICIYLIMINGRFEYQWLSFVFFLGAGIGGLWWVLSGDRPSGALTLASWLCPVFVFYSVTNIMIGNPITGESADPLVPFTATGLAFGLAVAAMLVPLLSEFDVALGRTGGGGE
jgi:ABC-type transport system involved in multi-copper enzyme maturation permease subunit